MPQTSASWYFNAGCSSCIPCEIENLIPSPTLIPSVKKRTRGLMLSISGSGCGDPNCQNVPSQLYIPNKMHLLSESENIRTLSIKTFSPKTFLDFECFFGLQILKSKAFSKKILVDDLSSSYNDLFSLGNLLVSRVQYFMYRILCRVCHV